MPLFCDNRPREIPSSVNDRSRAIPIPSTRFHERGAVNCFEPGKSVFRAIALNSGTHI